MRALLKKIIVWALTDGASGLTNAAADLDKLAASLKRSQSLAPSSTTA
jgi:hypothetical protein